jgi:hypothetical protein
VHNAWSEGCPKVRGPQQSTGTFTFRDDGGSAKPTLASGEKAKPEGSAATKSWATWQAKDSQSTGYPSKWPAQDLSRRICPRRLRPTVYLTPMLSFAPIVGLADAGGIYFLEKSLGALFR